MPCAILSGKAARPINYAHEYRLPHPLSQTSPTCPQTAQGAVLAIGNFDGVHLGHQQVIADARAHG